ncbi:GSCFA domain-containing protein [Bacteroides gallinaceum]|uniref:GSCFA domain-containing protein n=1 Tax=Bacteroides gallinaceum TaxID=1462571 RepID=UPI0025A45C30|nr:GSCFA domain-containing protein [Bacteroides gallinaceum]MDM8208302.1 GSCFA domain-containing protein [Bacteroides gallinaceum]
MEFRTTVEMPSDHPQIAHSDKLMVWGSCFAENIGKRLLDNKFQCDTNPFGVLYNPLSIAKAVKQLVCRKRYTPDDLMHEKDVWFSLMHHSSFNSPDREQCLQNINTRIEKGMEYLKQASWLIFTWGTARVYSWNENGEIVGNCHKLPERMFSRRLLATDEIVTVYEDLLNSLHADSPNMKMLFTVSPIRHAKDGMHGNQLSKATLLLAINELCARLPFCYYFPSYEIMMDELRDYRFYADDMLHPSQLATDYIWEQFSGTYLSGPALSFIKQWESIRKGLDHRPFNPQSDTYRKFVSQILLKIRDLKEKFPYLDVQNEEQTCQALLKK